MSPETLESFRFVSYLLSWAAFILAVVASMMRSSVICIFIAVVTAVNAGVSYAIGNIFLAGLLFGGTFIWLAIGSSLNNRPPD